jgi:tetratricopeptide (TPR) repeat protein
MSARLKSETDANRVFKQLEPILTDTIARMQRGDSNEIDRSTYVTLLSLLGFGYEFLGKTQAALHLYSEALRIEPNDALYVARGMLLYGTSAQAITDFETAMEHGTPLVWPYVMLAHHHLITGRFEESQRLCEQAIRIGGSATVMSEVCEWMAIAQSHLGFPADIVRASFDKAIRLDPANERAKRNLAAFEAASRPISWETRTTGAVRISGLAERRYAMAA